MTKTVPTADNLGSAHQQLAEADAARLRTQAVEAQAVEAAARERRLTEYDCAAYDTQSDRIDAAWIEEAAAHEQFRTALLTDPVFGAYLRLRTAVWARRFAAEDLEQAQRRLGVEWDLPGQGGGVDNRLLDELVTVIDTEAKRLAVDEADARAKAREAAGDGIGA